MEQRVQVDTGREILALTGLRFVAAFIVFVFHIHIRWPVTSHAYLANVISQGAIGMSVFFMLSGFILSYTYHRRSFSVLEFYRNRFARIYPVYSLAAVICLPWLIGLAYQGPAGLGKMASLVIADTFMIQAWFPQMFYFWNNAASWSLSTEAFFYALFPFLLAILSRLHSGALIAITVSIYVLCVFPGFVYAVFEPRPEPALAIFYAMPIFRLPEFMMGICVFLWVRRARVPRLGLLATAMIVALVSYLCVVGGRLPIFILHNWIVVPTVAVLMAALSQQGGMLVYVLGNRGFVWLGKISYCFYSFQFLVVFGILSIRDQLPASGLAIFFMALIPLLIMSAAGYHFVEEPCRKWLRSRSAERQIVS